MGRSLARKFVERGDSVAVLGRDLEELQKSQADLQARGSPGVRVVSVKCDLEAPETFRASLEQAEQGLEGLDTVVVTAGLFATQEKLEQDPALAHKVLTVDFANTVVFCEEARKKLLLHGKGTLCVFSSVAGDRARKPVVLYGAAKAGLSAYLEGLDHKYRAQGLTTICVKPGFVKTAMTAGLPVPPFAGDPDEVAQIVIEGIDAGTPVVYAPRIWQAVMTAIKAMPRFVMRRAKF
ncbi:MAG: SDR family NAD(P)-dependent oxidoreductase [Archangium sp.]|nr:SDR family NAD(P)-dependent oxidoreductase [Archangium sp.]